MNFREILFLFFGFLAILLGFLYIFKRASGFGHSNRTFGLLLLLSGWLIIYSALYWSGQFRKEPFIHVRYSYLIPLTLFAPLFFFYIRKMTIGKKITFKKDFFHFLPCLYFLFILVPFFVLSTEEKLKDPHIEISLFQSYNKFIELSFIGLSLVYGLVILFFYLPKYNRENKDFRLWLKAITISFTLAALSYLSLFILFYTKLVSIKLHYFITYFWSVSILITTYFSFNHSAIFEGKSFQKIMPFIKYKKTGLSETYSRELKESLMTIMLKDKPFLDREFRLEDLAQLLGVSRHHASQVINEHFKTNFFDFINAYRVEEAVNLIEQKGSDLGLAEIGFLAGFNNTVSFNKSFKKNVGVTPSKFRKKLLFKQLH